MNDERIVPVRELTDEEKAEVEQAHAIFWECVNMKQDKKDRMFNSGIFNDVAIGYGKMALETLGKDSKFLAEFEKAMKNAFDFYDASEARKIYNRVDG